MPYAERQFHELPFPPSVFPSILLYSRNLPLSTLTLATAPPLEGIQIKL